METIGLLAVLVCILLAAAISKRVQGTIVTLPMVYTLFGVLLGGLVLDIIPLTLENVIVELIAELTLIFILATDASRIELRSLFRDHDLPLRLLGAGLPLTMIFGTIAAVLIFTELSFWEAAILGVILTPTDASLGQSVVSHPRVPVRIRQTLNIESGLNDGIAMPFLLLAIGLAESEVLYNTPFGFLLSVLFQIGLGILAGAAIGYMGARFIQWGQRIGWMSRKFQKISSLALILMAYGIAEATGGNGFIAAFCFGLVFGNYSKKEEAEELYDHAETEVALLMLLTFLFFGAVMLPPAVGDINLDVVLFGLLSLTLVRILPVALSLIGAGVQWRTNLFLGWFGPRGVASILYAFIVLEHETLPGLERMYTVVMITVLLSIFAHGMTASPAADRYGKALASLAEAQKAEPENQSVSEMPLRAEH